MSGSGAFSPNQYDNHGMSFFGGFECFWQIRGGSSFHEPKTWQVLKWQERLPSLKLPEKVFFLFKRVIFRLHVSFRGYIHTYMYIYILYMLV